MTKTASLPDPLRTDSVAGDQPGQRALNGPQTTGRSFRNLSQAEHRIAFEPDVSIPMSDGVNLLADVYRPDDAQRHPALIAASCYPRQIQNIGAPMGFIEAGATDFWVPRGYTHVIANVRGTCGSGGTYGWLDERERADIAELVEWVAAQPWCDGNVGMIGISYFAMTQIAAATQAPPSLKALFPVATTANLYDAVWHHGLLSQTFVTAWIAGVATFAPHGDKAFRNHVTKALGSLLRTPRLHAHFQHLNGEAALSSLGTLLRAKYPEHPWDEIWRDVTVNHQFADEYWNERDMIPLLADCRIPMYLGCDWQNVPLHLPSTFQVWDAVNESAPTRIGMLGDGGLTWPWESLHVEALAWFDHWLKGHDTGVLDGDAVRYWLPGADEFRSAAQWPPESTLTDWYLGSSGSLTETATEGDREYQYIPPTLTRPKGAPESPLADCLTWCSPVLDQDVDIVGYAEVELNATTTAADVAWIVTLQDLAPDGTTTDVTAGWQRTTRSNLTHDSEPGHPIVDDNALRSITPHEIHTYRIPFVANARRFKRGHRIQLVLASDDINSDHPAIMGFRHQQLGEQTVNTIHATSRIRLPVVT